MIGSFSIVSNFTKIRIVQKMRSRAAGHNSHFAIELLHRHPKVPLLNHRVEREREREKSRVGELSC